MFNLIKTHLNLPDLELNKSKIYLDIEVYSNYFLAMFLFEEGKVVLYEVHNDVRSHDSVDEKMVTFLLTNFDVVSFNGNNYDLPILKCSLTSKYKNEELYRISKRIIESGSPWYQIEGEYSQLHLMIKSRDLLNVAPDPNKISLKMYAARMLTERLEDLPISPDSIIESGDVMALRKYCYKDVLHTKMLSDKLKVENDMRDYMSFVFKINLLSASDAQIGERVILSMLKKHMKVLPKPPNLRNTSFVYKAPDFIKFKTDYLKLILNKIESCLYQINDNGSPVLPKELSFEKIVINKSTYTLGIGGLHSNEEKTTHVCGEDEYIMDIDVESYYPNIILNCNYAPEQFKDVFLKVYKDELVLPRIQFKHNSNSDSYTKEQRDEFKKLSDSYKIAINGSYGKFGSPFCPFYSPNLMVSVCLTGQLGLLMLIESMELAGISVISANTDGIVVKYTGNQKNKVFELKKEWESLTNFKLEETYYKALHSMNVNNYIAVKSDETCVPTKGVKCKGLFADHWFESKSNFSLKSTPTFLVCRKAVLEYCLKGTPVEDTIRSCDNLIAFTSVRNVTGGGMFRGVDFGRVARFYKSKTSKDSLVYKKSGNKVPLSDNCVLVMDMVDFKNDLDYDFYKEYAESMLFDLGVWYKNKQTSLFDF